MVIGLGNSGQVDREKRWQHRGSDGDGGAM